VQSCHERAEGVEEKKAKIRGRDEKATFPQGDNGPGKRGQEKDRKFGHPGPFTSKFPRDDCCQSAGKKGKRKHIGSNTGGTERRGTYSPEHFLQRLSAEVRGGRLGALEVHKKEKTKRNEEEAAPNKTPKQGDPSELWSASKTNATIMGTLSEKNQPAIYLNQGRKEKQRNQVMTGNKNRKHYR